MDVLSAAYLSKPGNRQSATTTLVQTKEIESTLIKFTAAFSEGIDRALAVHAAHKALPPVATAGFSVPVACLRLSND